MQLSVRDKKLIWMGCGLLLFVLVYMYVFIPLQDKTEQMQNKITRLERECRDLEKQSVNMAEYEAKIEEYRTSVKEALEIFPADVKEEDILVYLLDLQEDNEIEIFSTAFNEPAVIVDFDGIVEVEGEEKTVHMLGLQMSTTSRATFTYEKFKDVLDYIYATNNQTTLESVTVIYDSKKDALNGSLEFSKYALLYEDAVYTPEKLPEVEIGQEELFGNR